MYVPKDLVDYICVLGHDHHVIRQIARRLRTKWSEVIASTNVKSKLYIVEPPQPSSMGRDVIVSKEWHLTKASLLGEPSNGGGNSAFWSDRAELIRSKNKDHLLNAVDKSLRGVAFVRGHLRMRVNFGTFVLNAYRCPKDDKPSYPLEEFREMMLHEQTKGRLIPGYGSLLQLISSANFAKLASR